MVGRFLHVEEELIRGEDKRFGCMLVEVDICRGLMVELEIEWRGKFYCHKMDYWGVPFRCSLCRNVGHLRKECLGISTTDRGVSTSLKLLKMKWGHLSQRSSGSIGWMRHLSKVSSKSSTHLYFPH